MVYKTSTGSLAPISNVKEISLSWCQDSSDENARKMFEVTYGQFEKRSNLWRIHMEQDIMKEVNLAYRDEEEPIRSGETGCISKLITAGITEIRKNLNRAGKKHGRSIGIRNRNNEGKKQKRRKMGEYMACFVKSTGDFNDSPDDVKSSKANDEGNLNRSDEDFHSACQSDEALDFEENEISDSPKDDIAGRFENPKKKTGLQSFTPNVLRSQRTNDKHVPSTKVEKRQLSKDKDIPSSPASISDNEGTHDDFSSDSEHVSMHAMVS